MRILYITDYLPFPPVSGDSIRLFNLMKNVGKHHQISVIALFSGLVPVKDISPLLEFSERVEIIGHQWPSAFRIWPDLASYFLRGIPPELRMLYSQKLADTMARLDDEEHFDIVHFEHSRMALYLKALRPNVKRRTILAFQNVAFDQFKRISQIEKELVKKLRTRLHSTLMRSWEPRFAERFDRCVTVSDADRGLLLEANPRLAIDVIPNGIDTLKNQSLEANHGGSDLLFIGSMSYEPCVDGALFFCKEILPLVQERLGGVNLWIVGANPVKEVRELANASVRVTGYVEDILPYYNRTSVSIVPLRAGGGTRLKILESMALGRPVVSTSIGCEGLGLVDGQHILVADNPEDFAHKIVGLLRDDELYQKVASQARKVAVETYDWTAISQKLLNTYENVMD